MAISIEVVNRESNNSLLQPFRILIVGTTGSGKTSLANKIAQLLSIPHVELDTFHWNKNWQKYPENYFLDSVSSFINSNNEWIIDGNYRSYRDKIWPNANTLIWLDYPLPIILIRLFKRSFIRLTENQIIWNGNRTSLMREFFGKNSILYDTLYTYRFRKKDYSLAIADIKYKHLNIIHFYTPRDVDDWIKELSKTF